MEHLKAFDDEINAFLDNMFGPRDSRVRGWFMLDSYLPTFFLTVIYLLSIWLGNKYMKNRPALSLRGILTSYNLGITLLSLYMLVELVLSSWEGGYNLQCQDLASAGEADIRVAKVLWWYYFSKLIEFLDTIFFVLRKKTSQITFLHVYHHASMFNIWWCVLNWIPCGQSAVCAHHYAYHECCRETVWLPLRLSHLPVFVHAYISHPILKFLCSDIPKKASEERHGGSTCRERSEEWFFQSLLDRSERSDRQEGTVTPRGRQSIHNSLTDSLVLKQRLNSKLYMF
uniref:Elongation of very long chain fatty acids protein n=1 Tax=Equus asinus TaxID=9793 RepID=A0A9L0JBX5_EQUAS